ncbi:phosphopantetheine-binding protein [Pseudonocardia sp. CNS-139]|nr:phosphopantetheine-binding protein [Pseudonocardia sp. CNS-139]
MTANGPDTTTDAVLDWSRSHVAELLGVAPERIDPTVDFDSLGIDSALAVSLLTEIEDRYDVELPPEELFANPTLAAVARFVHEHAGQPATSA